MRPATLCVLLLVACSTIEYPGGETTDAIDPSTISRGFNHACATTVTGGMACWGRNDSMQLGAPRADYYLTPQTPEVGPLRLHSPVAGSGTTCALDDQSRVWCWGSLKRSPRLVAEGRKLADLKASMIGFCGRDSGNAIHCWGGVFGLGSPSYKVEGSETIASYGLSEVRGCGVRTDSVAVCWAVDGQTVPDTAPGGFRWRSISPGAVHVCGVTSDGVTRCWGDNYHLQLGQTAFVPSSDTPLPVPTPVPVDTLLRVSAGSLHNCALAVSGKVFCWGSGALGALGRGNVGNFHDSLPRPVIGLPTSAVSLGTRGDQTCAELADGSTWCWGYQPYGEFGLGTTGVVWTPVRTDQAFTTAPEVRP